MSVQIQRPSTRILTLGTPGLSIVQPVAAAGGLTGDWWLGNATIAAGAVEDYIENHSGNGTAYTGSAIADSNPYTLAFYTTGIVAATNSGAKYMFSGNLNKPTIGMNGTNHSIYLPNSWRNLGGFVDTNMHVWMFVQSGSSIQMYVDNVATGSAVSRSDGIAGAAIMWGSNYNNGTTSPWPNEIVRAACYNIALDATQRSNLYEHMLVGSS